MFVSIGIVYSTSASRICFVGDAPAKIAVLTLRSSRRLDILSVLFSLLAQRFQDLMSFPQGVLSSEVRETCCGDCFPSCLLHFVREMRLGYACNTSFHCHIFHAQCENSFSLDATTVTLSRVITASFHPDVNRGDSVRPWMTWTPPVVNAVF